MVIFFSDGLVALHSFDDCVLIMISDLNVLFILMITILLLLHILVDLFIKIILLSNLLQFNIFLSYDVHCIFLILDSLL